jgi:hypothetical protein
VNLFAEAGLPRTALAGGMVVAARQHIVDVRGSERPEEQPLRA